MLIFESPEVASLHRILADDITLLEAAGAIRKAPGDPHARLRGTVLGA